MDEIDVREVVKKLASRIKLCKVYLIKSAGVLQFCSFFTGLERNVNKKFYYLEIHSCENMSMKHYKKEFNPCFEQKIKWVFDFEGGKLERRYKNIDNNSWEIYEEKKPDIVYDVLKLDKDFPIVPHYEGWVSDDIKQLYPNLITEKDKYIYLLELHFLDQVIDIVETERNILSLEIEKCQSNWEEYTKKYSNDKRRC